MLRRTQTERRLGGQAQAGTWAVMAGGGTAGHIIPGLAVAETLVGRGRSRSEVLFFVSEKGADAHLLEDAGYPHATIPGKGLARKASLSFLATAASILHGAWVAWRLLGRLRPAVMLLQGGYVSASCAVAARLRGIPSVVFEANAAAGLASRLASRRARACAVAFSGTGLPRQVLTGTPVRPEIAALADSPERVEHLKGPLRRRAANSAPEGEAALTPDSRQAAKAALGLPQERRLILVLGGSLGSASINAATREAAGRLLASGDVAIRHVVGPRAWREEDWSRPQPVSRHYRILPFEDDMATALAASEIVLSRAGGGALAELAAAARPSLLIPLSSAAEGHQHANARAYVESGASVLLEEGDLSAETLASALGELISDAARLEKMSEASATLARPHAADDLADLLEEHAKQ